jgi:phage gpG-like protein
MEIKSFKPAGKDYGVRLSGLEDTYAFLTDVVQEFGSDSEFMQEIADDVTDMVRDQGISGVDINGRPGAPLSKKYEKKKIKLGKQSIRNMSLFGKMYNSLDNVVLPTKFGSKAIIFFGDTLQSIIAAVHNFGFPSGRKTARFTMPTFEHFGLSKRMIDTINKKLFDRVERFLNNWRR